MQFLAIAAFLHSHISSRDDGLCHDRKYREGLLSQLHRSLEKAFKWREGSALVAGELRLGPLLAIEWAREHRERAFGEAAYESLLSDLVNPDTFVAVRHTAFGNRPLISLSFYRTGGLWAHSARAFGGDGLQLLCKLLEQYVGIIHEVAPYYAAVDWVRAALLVVLLSVDLHGLSHQNREVYALLAGTVHDAAMVFSEMPVGVDAQRGGPAKDTTGKVISRLQLCGLVQEGHIVSRRHRVHSAQQRCRDTRKKTVCDCAQVLGCLLVQRMLMIKAYADGNRLDRTASCARASTSTARDSIVDYAADMRRFWSTCDPVDPSPVVPWEATSSRTITERVVSDLPCPLLKWWAQAMGACHTPFPPPEGHAPTPGKPLKSEPPHPPRSLGTAEELQTAAQAVVQHALQVPLQPQAPAWSTRVVETCHLPENSVPETCPADGFGEGMEPCDVQEGGVTAGGRPDTLRPRAVVNNVDPRPPPARRRHKKKTHQPPPPPPKRKSARLQPEETTQRTRGLQQITDIEAEKQTPEDDDAAAAKKAEEEKAAQQREAEEAAAAEQKRRQPLRRRGKAPVLLVDWRRTAAQGRGHLHLLLELC